MLAPLCIASKTPIASAALTRGCSALEPLICTVPVWDGTVAACGAADSNGGVVAVDGRKRPMREHTGSRERERQS